MYPSTILEHWSAHLRRRGNDAALTFGPDGSLALLVERRRVDCRIAPESLHLRARVCSLPDHRSEAERHAWLCRILMLTNTHAHRRREIPVLDATGALQLRAWIRVRADYQEFCNEFDQFIDALDAWRRAMPPGELTPAASMRPSGIPFSSTLSDPSQGSL